MSLWVHESQSRRLRTEWKFHNSFTCYPPIGSLLVAQKSFDHVINTLDTLFTLSSSFTPLHLFSSPHQLPSPIVTSSLFRTTTDHETSLPSGSKPHPDLREEAYGGIRQDIWAWGRYDQGPDDQSVERGNWKRRPLRLLPWKRWPVLGMRWPPRPTVMLS